MTDQWHLGSSYIGGHGITLGLQERRQDAARSLLVPLFTRCGQWWAHSHRPIPQTFNQKPTGATIHQLWHVMALSFPRRNLLMVNNDAPEGADRIQKSGTCIYRNIFYLQSWSSQLCVTSQTISILQNHPVSRSGRIFKCFMISQ